MKKRRSLTEAERRAADALARIYGERKKALQIGSQEELGGMVGMTQGAVYQYLRGIIALNLEAVFKFAGALRVPPHEIYPEIIEGLPAPLITREPIIEYVVPPIMIAELGQRERALLASFGGLTHAQQDEAVEMLTKLAAQNQRFVKDLMASGSLAGKVFSGSAVSDETVSRSLPSAPKRAPAHSKK